MLTNAFESHLARVLHRNELDVSYGSTDGQRADIFPARTPGSPVLLFIHGGYFRALDKSQYRYLARPLVKLGYAVVLVNYDLAPRVSVSEIVQQVHDAFAWVKQNVHRWNGDPGRFTLCGHSVGAFLAAKVLEEDWPNGSGIEKAALLSGLYDLGPMKRSFLNHDLQLTDEEVSNLNPRADALTDPPNILVAVGSKETDQFVSQSESYSRTLSAAGVQNDLMILRGINHYTMSRLLSRKGSPVLRWIVGDPPR